MLLISLIAAVLVVIEAIVAVVMEVGVEGVLCASIVSHALCLRVLLPFDDRDVLTPVFTSHHEIHAMHFRLQHTP